MRLLDLLSKAIKGNASDTVASAGLGLGAILNTLDWDHVREEVDRENRARIVLIGSVGAGKSTLLNTLKGSEVSPIELPDEPIDVVRLEDYGLFAVIDVPGDHPSEQLHEGDTAWFVLQNADLIVWLLDGVAGVRAWEHEWIGRVRAAGKPLMLVLNKIDQVPDRRDVDQLSRVLACPIVPISARDGTNIVAQLLPRIVDASPNLTTALGREVLAWRRIAAERVTRRAMALGGLVGVEPVPLLDIPFQVLIQLRLVLRLASIYGEPLGDRYSRELLATTLGGVLLRYISQQLVKLIPLAGWIASGALAAGGTWAIGEIATEYFENGRHLPHPTLPDLSRSRSIWEQRNPIRAITPLAVELKQRQQSWSRSLKRRAASAAVAVYKRLPLKPRDQ